MAEWIYNKKRLPNDCELKWVAVHNSHYNCNDLKGHIIQQTIKSGVMYFMNCLMLLKTFTPGEIL